MPEITEDKLYEAFGLEKPEPNEGAKEPEVTEPAEGADNTMSPDERHQNAQRRRDKEKADAELEKQNAINEAVAKVREEYKQREKEAFAKMGLKNSITGEDIDSFDSVDKWKESYDDQKLENDLKEGRLDKGALASVVRQEVEKLAQQNAQRESDDKIIADDLKKIQEINPNIKSVADLVNMEKADVFKEYVKKGFSFSDAYKLTHFDDIRISSAETAAKAAYNNSRGKDHLTASGNSRGAGSVQVPPDEMRMFRVFNPKATDEEIQKFYNEHRKE